ncbi:hypothetical protein F2Q68_00031964 [Brassica cretica]|uniref:Uncharacterized protein n=1 Tax=Brassica cretica TaxID=69181 RepID=A0A8S9G5D6_BRACR|nr:hypothetical protein F2Q68_00031964 [Brassica cretica]
MAQDDATFGASGGEPTPTPKAAPPLPADFMSSVMARQDVQKMTNEQLVALVAALTAPDGQTSCPQLIRRRLFNTNLTATGGDHPTNCKHIEVILSQQTLPSDDENDDAPAPRDLRDVLKRKLEPEDGNSSDDTDLRLTLNAQKSQRVLTSGHFLKERPKRSCSDLRDKLNANMCDLRVLLIRSKPTDLRRQLERTKTPGNSTLPQNDDDAPTDLHAFLNSKRPTNRKHIEVILSQQTLPSDDENDDAPAPRDLRDVLKRKLEPEDGNSSDDTDLRLTLNARKSQRVLTSGHVLKERPKRSCSDLRDKLNANMCDLRVLLIRSKPIDLRRQLERTKTPGNSTLPQNDDDAPTDLHAFLNSKRVNSRPRLTLLWAALLPA